jgi:CelD/BcsL family acetyltransferase involved in cellulose biosynthesis
VLDSRLIEDLDALAPAWEALWRRTPSATPFQSPAWLIPWMRAFAPGELRVAAAFDGRDLVALFPFYLERGPHGRRLLPLGVSLSDYLDVLVDPSAPEAAALVVARLGATEWDEWRFEALPPGAAALALAPPDGVEQEQLAQDACPVLALRGPDLARSVPARQRRKLRRARAAAERIGAVEFAADMPADDFLDGLFALHRARWESRGEGGVLADPRVQAFHRAALPRLQQQGIARTLVMRVAGRPVGAYYGLRRGGCAYAYLGGFDPAFEDASPGALTIEAACAEAAASGATELHFLRGREAYKYAWGAEDRINNVRIWRRRG